MSFPQKFKNVIFSMPLKFRNNIYILEIFNINEPKFNQF